MVLLLRAGDDFPSAQSLLEAVFALEEEANPPGQSDNSQGNPTNICIYALMNH